MKSSKLILTLSAIILVTTLLTLVITLNKYGVMTGRASDTATANLTIDTQASISFTDAECNFGSGSVEEIPTEAILYSNGTIIDATGGSWTGCTDGLNLSNDGNVNVSVVIDFGEAASTFIGGTGPGYAVNVTSSACTGTDTLADSWTEVTGNDQAACTDWDYGEWMQIHLRLTVPEDAVGTRGTVITATASA